MNKIELLAPAGDLQRLKTAVRYGADAVYIGGRQFSLRSRASNFTLEDIREGAAFAREHGASVHVTVNMLPHEDDFDGLKEYVEQLCEAGVHALIVASPAIARFVVQHFPQLEVHISTQHSTTNSSAIRFWKQMGMHRVVLARECSLAQITETTRHSVLPVEVFIHGGMCISYSGRCVLSNHMTNRDANRGGCAQSCRWKYELYQGDTRISDEQELFSMSSKDLQAAAYIPALIDAGVSSLKIEGRMKSTYYIATVVHAYRALIDEYMEKGVLDASRIAFYEQEIAKAENRPTSCGFYRGLPQAGGHLYGVNGAGVTQEYIADVIAYDEATQTALLQVKNHFRPHIEAEVFGPHTPSTRFEIGDVCDLEGRPLEVLNQPMQMVRMKCSLPLEEHAMIRKVYDRSGRHVY